MNNAHPNYKRARVSTNFIFWFVFGGLALVSTVINIQPWFSVGAYIAGQVQIIPFQGLLEGLPFIGGWFALTFAALGAVIGGILWAAVQLVQIAPIIAEYPWFMAGSPGKKEFLVDLKKWRLVAYPIEIATLFLHYPPYGNVWQDLFRDAPYIDNNLWQWGEIGMLVVTMLAFEAVIAFTLSAWEKLSR